jgi:hypothetical protein
MKTIEELANLGAAAAALKNPETFLIGISPESQFWKGDQPAREAFARAVRDAVLADQPAADVPTWRPIAELPDDEWEYVYWDGEMSWHGNPQEKVDATHFIVPPTTKPDPFDVWWATQNRTGKHKAECLEAWNAAVASTSEKEFYEEAAKLVGRPINLP